MSHAKKRILVVDDEPTITRLLKLNLEQTGDYEVATENDSQAALATAKEFRPDLILLDVMMPKMDGYELCDVLRQNAPTAQTPTVLLASKAGLLPNFKGMMSGFNDALSKPMSPLALREMVGKYCSLLIEVDALEVA